MQFGLGDEHIMDVPCVTWPPVCTRAPPRRLGSPPTAKATWPWALRRRLLLPLQGLQVCAFILTSGPGVHAWAKQAGADQRHAGGAERGSQDHANILILSTSTQHINACNCRHTFLPQTKVVGNNT